jgi:hypothetical protein
MNNVDPVSATDRRDCDSSSQQLGKCARSSETKFQTAGGPRDDMYRDAECPYAIREIALWASDQWGDLFRQRD